MGLLTTCSKVKFIQFTGANSHACKMYIYIYMQANYQLENCNRVVVLPFFYVFVRAKLKAHINVYNIQPS